MIELLVYFMVHVGDLPGQAQLLAGDVVQLEQLLSESNVVKLFQLNRDKNQSTRLSNEEARTLLDELRGIDPELLDGKDGRYCRSAMHSDLATTRKDLVEGFVEFLEAELRTVTSI